MVTNILTVKTLEKGQKEDHTVREDILLSKTPSETSWLRSEEMIGNEAKLNS